MIRSSKPVTDAELAEALAVLAALGKATHRSTHEVPPGLKALWTRFALAPRHATLVVSLALAGPISVSDLSARLGIGLPTASLMVGELSRAGVVTRTEDEEDRRRTLVDLAPACRQSAREFVMHKSDLVRRALEPLEPGERAALIKGMRALISALDADALDWGGGLRLPLESDARPEPAAKARRMRR